MDSNAIFDALEEIAKTPGKNDKQALLKKYMDDDEFKGVVKMALDPFVRFNIARRPTVTKSGDKVLGQHTTDVLTGLSMRTLTGNAARDILTDVMEGLTPKSQEVMWRMVSKDLRAGFGASSVNKCVKGFIPEFSYMRCSLPKHVKLSEWDWGRGVISQEKADGQFDNLTVQDGVVTMVTRQGSPLDVSKFPEIEQEALKAFVDGFQTHGEILVEVNGVIAKRHIGNGIINRILDGGDFEPGERPIYRAWDQIPVVNAVKKGKYLRPYEDRLADLIRQITYVTPATKTTSAAIALIETRIVHSMKEAYQHYLEVLRRSGEGTIVKRREGIWKDGTSKDQVKLKLEAPCELEVYGYEEGNGKNADLFGSLKCRTSDHLLSVNVSGFTDAMRKDIHENMERWTGGGEGGYIITVISNEILEPSASNPLHSLFLPRFEEVRNDKSKADTLERVREQFANAIKKLEDVG